MKANEQICRASKIFHKTDVYGYYKVIDEKETVCKPIKFNGWSDGVFEYYANEERWHVIDPNTGISITTGDNRKRARINAYSKEVQNRFNLWKQKDDYKNLCIKWKQIIDEIKEYE